MTNADMVIGTIYKHRLTGESVLLVLIEGGQSWYRFYARFSDMEVRRVYPEELETMPQKVDHVSLIAFI